ncbi:DUF1697 domain-containing protein [Nitriliruptor alkaliphilus]|uniref:DUF1697 domain-containing protein n=1 Tax=Nitriliruptor alkaliphilus TaxID=427918 RepID=UPI000696188B|nr:DUF1697 domain-containing protein [Nitriliruptor alkaliphilus]
MRYAAFLRGINLGKRRVTGPELCAPFEGLGFTEVASFLASGNVVFETDDDAGAGELGTRIASALEEALGYEVLTFLRSVAELAAIVARTPFTADQLARSTGKPQVLLLPREPAADDAAAALAHGSDDDVLVLDGRELHWLPSGGVSQSDLDLTAIGRAVGPVTIRTANTLSRMHTKFFAA